MVPGEADVLAEEEFAIISDVTAMRQRRFGFRPKIWAMADRQPKVPHWIRAEADTAVETRMIQTDRRQIPGCRSRRERRIFHFGSVIELSEAAGNGNAARITWAPNH